MLFRFRKLHLQIDKLDRYTYRQIYEYIFKCLERLIDIYIFLGRRIKRQMMFRQVERQIDEIQTCRNIDKQIERKIDKQIERKIDEQKRRRQMIYRQVDRQIQRYKTHSACYSYLANYYREIKINSQKLHFIYIIEYYCSTFKRGNFELKCAVFNHIFDQ